MMSDSTLSDWNRLPDELQLVVADAALRRAAETLATQAELLAREIEGGALADRGGPDALRLFAAVVRLNGRETFATAGHA